MYYCKLRHAGPRGCARRDGTHRQQARATRGVARPGRLHRRRLALPVGVRSRAHRHRRWLRSIIRALLGSVSFASIDGPAAVTLFFVLSGFVLPLGFFRSGRTELVVRATAKRWLRLVCLVMLAVLLSWLLFRFGLYRHREAAQISQSAWLGTFGGSHPGKDFTPSLSGAVLEGSLLAFLREPDMYNPVLWTMHHEFLGSFVTFFLAVTLWRARPAGRDLAAGNRRRRGAFHRSIPVRLRRRHRPRVAHVALRCCTLSPAVALRLHRRRHLPVRLSGATRQLCGVLRRAGCEPGAVRPDRHTHRQRRVDHHRPARQRPARPIAGNAHRSVCSAACHFRCICSTFRCCARWPARCSCCCGRPCRYQGTLLLVAAVYTAAGHRRWLSVRLRGRGLARLGQPVRRRLTQA